MISILFVKFLKYCSIICIGYFISQAKYLHFLAVKYFLLWIVFIFIRLWFSYWLFISFLLMIQKIIRFILSRFCICLVIFIIIKFFYLFITLCNLFNLFFVLKMFASLLFIKADGLVEWFIISVELLRWLIWRLPIK